MTSVSTLAFLGGGNMASAMIQGLVRGRFVESSQVVVAEPVATRREELVAQLGVRAVAENVEALRDADVVVLAVKPQVMDDVLAKIAPHVGGRALVISIAAGVSLAKLEAALGAASRVVRTMPNTPALVSASATGISAGSRATPADVETARALFATLGEVAVLPESLLDAVTGLSGSGPAYVYLFIEALADGGVRAGLPRDAAMRLAAQTVLGAARLVLETGMHPGALKDQVTSPGGTTIAGVHALEQAGFRGAVMDAVLAAATRATELGAASKK